MADQQDVTHQAQPPAGVASTADAAVDAILARLEEVRGSQAADHEAIYASIHDELLAELDADPPGPVPGPADGA